MLKKIFKRFFGKKQGDDRKEYIPIIDGIAVDEEGRFIFPPEINLKEVDTLQLALNTCLITGQVVVINRIDDGLKINGLFYPY